MGINSNQGDMMDKTIKTLMDKLGLPEYKAKEAYKIVKGECGDKKEKIEFDEVVRLFHENCPSFPRVLKSTPGRKRKVRARLKEIDNGIEEVKEVFVKMESSKFLRGYNSTGWRASFDWIFKNDSNWAKVMEGNYEESNNKKSTNGEGNNERSNITRLAGEILKGAGL